MVKDSKKIQEELQFLLEEDSRVITYKFVSANFGIHVNDAKRHLQLLLGTCRSKGDDDVTATFYLSGLCDEQGDYVLQKSLVVSEDRLAAARSSLTSVTSEHVFSLQRHRVSDTAVLYGADQQERQTDDPAAYNSHGAITNRRAERVPAAELLKARKAAAPPVAQPPKRPPAAAPAPTAVREEPAPAAAEKPPTGPPADRTSKADRQHAKAETGEKGKSGKSSAAGKGNTNIASMFAKAATEKKTKSPPKKPVGGGMMDSFLRRGAEKKPVPVGGDAGSAAPAPAPAAVAERSDPPAVKEEVMETVRFGAKKAGGGRGGGRGKRPRKGSGAGSGGPAKQRRRIQVLASDSDSSDQEDDGDRDQEEPEPEPAPPPPESDEEPEPQRQQPRRRRKLVTKTFVDDEGFMVTKKEYESCSGSESEQTPADNAGAAAEEKPKAAPAPAQVEPAKPSKPKETGQHKVKQPGIMSFFKKK